MATVTGDTWTFTTASVYVPEPDPATGDDPVWPPDDPVDPGGPLPLGTNFMSSFRRLVAACGNTLYIENI